jgi:predicted amidohydrolase
LAREAPQRPRIAVAQYSPQHGNVTQNKAASLDRIQSAADQNAAMVVLPECCLTGLVFQEREELAALAETLDGPAVEAWCAISARRNIHVVAGFAERRGSDLFNTAVLISPEGAMAAYRKTHLFGNERRLFDPGDRLVCADTPWGRVGLAICYDLWFPEVTRSLALSGATLIASPSNWFTPPRQKHDNAAAIPMAFHLAVAAACSNEVTIACADRTGEEGDMRFLGRSFVIGPNGRALAGPAGIDEDILLIAEWPDIMETRRQVQSHLETRRPDLYAAPVGVFPAHDGGRSCNRA